jgi:hypothetical protein
LTTIGRAEVDSFLEDTASLLRRAMFQGRAGTGFLACAGESAYPYSYTRDMAAILAAMCELGAVEAATPFAEFLLVTQCKDGSWPECVDTEGAALDVPRHEDATALALWSLLTYLRRGGEDRLRERVRPAAEAATQFTMERTLNTYIYLVETTASLHGGPTSEGYELWNNCAHASAFALAHKVYGGERYRRLALLIRRAIGLLMVHESRFLRRLDPSGYPDPRPDMALLAPYYFALWAPTERTVMNSAELIERTLWNVEMGGYVRHLPYSPAERGVLPGTWPCYTAWMAQYHYELGNKDRAEAILHWLFNNREGGDLPEVLVPAASAHRYLREQRLGARARNGGRKRSGEASISNAGQPERLMLDLDYVERMAVERQVMPLGAPHVWSHLETARALRRGGYIERWELQPLATRHG